MNENRFRKILREEVKKYLKERVTSKVLDVFDLEEVFKKFILKKFNYEEDFVENKVKMYKTRDSIVVKGITSKLEKFEWNKFLKNMVIMLGIKIMEKFICIPMKLKK